MPKLKTKKGALKRFQFSKGGKIKRKKAYKSHILTKKNGKRIVTSNAEKKSIRKMLPYM
jgi:large subunit ribosomal protein L35